MASPEYMKDWRERTRETRNALRRERYAERRAKRTPEQVAADRLNKRRYDVVYNGLPDVRAKRGTYKKDYWKGNKETLTEYNQNYQMKRKYGITLRERNDMFIKQENSCAICQRALPEWGRLTHVDHCHTTGKVRGILCSRCNTCVAWFEEQSLTAITTYLARSV